MWILSTANILTNLDNVDNLKVAQDPTSQKWAIKAWVGCNVDVQTYPNRESAESEYLLVIEALAKKGPTILHLKGGE